jgi:hypothetical protein
MSFRRLLVVLLFIVVTIMMQAAFWLMPEADRKEVEGVR